MKAPEVQKFRPLVIVAGMGRCGTSLMMQMLSAGGLHCYGEWPAFEDMRVSYKRLDQLWIDGLAECALKIIDPRTVGFRRPHRSLLIWLDRDPVEQARSAIKFLRYHDMPVDTSRSAWRAMAAALRRDRGPHRMAAGAHWGEHASMTLNFEDVIRWPGRAADRIGVFLAGHGYLLDTVAMAEQVRPRSVECLPYLMELEMIPEPEDDTP